MPSKYNPPQQDKVERSSQKLIETQNATIAELKRCNAILEAEKRYLSDSLRCLQAHMTNLNIRLGEVVTRMHAAEREVSNRGIMITVLTEKIRSLEGYILSQQDENLELQDTQQSSKPTFHGDVEIQAEKIQPQPLLATVEAQLLKDVEIMQTGTHIPSCVLQDAPENVSQNGAGQDQEEQEGSASDEDKHLEDQKKGENSPENASDEFCDGDKEVFDSSSRLLEFAKPIDSMLDLGVLPVKSSQKQQEEELTALGSALSISREELQLERKLRKQHQKAQRKLDRELKLKEAGIQAKYEAEAKIKARMEKAELAAENKAQAQAEAEAEAKRKATQEAKLRHKAEEAEKRRIRALEKVARRKAAEAEERASINARHERELARYRATQAAVEAEKKAGKQQDEGRPLRNSAQEDTQKKVETKRQLVKEDVIQHTVKVLTTRTEQETAPTSAAGPKVAVITLPVLKSQETVVDMWENGPCNAIENWKNRVRLHFFCSQVCDKRMPDIRLTKPDSKLQESFLFLVMLEINTKLGPEVFTIHDDEKGGYFFKCTIKETESDPVTFGPVNLETISFWLETDALRETCFTCYPRLLKNFSEMQTKAYDCVREEIQEKFKQMLNEAQHLWDTLELQKCTGEVDGWGLDKYSILMRRDGSKDKDSAIYERITLAQISLLVWYLTGKLAYLAKI